MWFPFFYSVVPISNHMDGLTTSGWLQTACRINDSSVQWLIRNLHQCQQEQPWGLRLFRQVECDFCWCFGNFITWHPFLKLYLLQTCRLPSMHNGWDAEKHSHYFLIQNFIYQTIREGFVFFFFNFPLRWAESQGLHLSYRLKTVWCYSHQHITKKNQASLCTRVVVLGCTRKEDERIMIPFLQIPFIPEVTQGADV